MNMVDFFNNSVCPVINETVSTILSEADSSRVVPVVTALAAIAVIGTGIAIAKAALSPRQLNLVADGVEYRSGNPTVLLVEVAKDRLFGANGQSNLAATRIAYRDPTHPTVYLVDAESFE